VNSIYKLLNYKSAVVPGLAWQDVVFKRAYVSLGLQCGCGDNFEPPGLREGDGTPRIGVEGI
jgi:hypothetical protein